MVANAGFYDVANRFEALLDELNQATDRSARKKVLARMWHVICELDLFVKEHVKLFEKQASPTARANALRLAREVLAKPEAFKAFRNFGDE